jgi:hypothetical protein
MGCDTQSVNSLGLNRTSGWPQHTGQQLWIESQAMGARPQAQL